MPTFNDPGNPSVGTGLQSGLPDTPPPPSGHSNGSGPELLQSVTQGAHQTIDRLAEQVTPHVQRLQENMANASEMIDERTDQLRDVTSEWMGSLRTTVRDNPLAAVGAALAIGMLVARLSR